MDKSDGVFVDLFCYCLAGRRKVDGLLDAAILIPKVGILSALPIIFCVVVFGDRAVREGLGREKMEKCNNCRGLGSDVGLNSSPGDNQFLYGVADLFNFVLGGFRQIFKRKKGFLERGGVFSGFCGFIFMANIFFGGGWQGLPLVFNGQV